MYYYVIRKVKESLYEKFTVDSDPIKDLGIGNKFASIEVGDIIRSKMPFKTHNGYIINAKEKAFSIKKCAGIIRKINKENNELELTGVFFTDLNMFDMKRTLSYDDKHWQSYTSQTFKGTYEKWTEIFEVIKKEDILQESLTEKFIEDSDPIQDMEIGSYAIWQKQKEKLWHTIFGDLNEKYFKKYDVDTNSINKGFVLEDVLCDIFKHLANKIKPQTAFNKAFNEHRSINNEKELTSKRKRIMAEVLKDHFNIDIKLRKESLDERYVYNANAEEYPINNAKKLLLMMLPIHVPRTRFYNVRRFLMDIIADPNTHVSGEDNIIYLKTDHHLSHMFFNDLQHAFQHHDLELVKDIKKEDDDTIKITLHKRIKESLNEKFTEDSDPIRDMGIGTYVYGKVMKFKTQREFYSWLIVMIPSILKTSKIPENIISETGSIIRNKYYFRIDAYLDKYTNHNEINDLYWNDGLRERLKRKGFKASKH